MQQTSNGLSWLKLSAPIPGLPKAVIENPALADWFFYHRVIEFTKTFFTRVLGATDYSLRFEWQHWGSPHVHGLAWLPIANLTRCGAAK